MSNGRNCVVSIVRKPTRPGNEGAEMDCLPLPPLGMLLFTGSIFRRLPIRGSVLNILPQDHHPQESEGKMDYSRLVFARLREYIHRKPESNRLGDFVP
jgi:hypothetical protein